MVIIARFNLEIKQFDVTNAFLYNNINKEHNKMFYKLPDNYKKLLRFPKGSTDGMAIELEKALYNLRESSLLWYNEFVSAFKTVGLDKVNEEPYIFINGRILVFFYVDDILVFFCNEEE